MATTALGRWPPCRTDRERGGRVGFPTLLCFLRARPLPLCHSSTLFHSATPSTLAGRQLDLVPTLQTAPPHPLLSTPTACFVGLVPCGRYRMEPARSRQQQEFRPGTCTVVFFACGQNGGGRQPAPAGMEGADGIGSQAWSSEVREKAA
jgi:hypothetical protein